MGFPKQITLKLDNLKVHAQIARFINSTWSYKIAGRYHSQVIPNVSQLIKNRPPIAFLGGINGWRDIFESEINLKNPWTLEWINENRTAPDPRRPRRWKCTRLEYSWRLDECFHAHTQTPHSSSNKLLLVHPIWEREKRTRWQDTTVDRRDSQKTSDFDAVLPRFCELYGRRRISAA